ncbi:MAG: sigma-70 family RNA polymerase sigma factor [Candidatus Vogelbacteria bacterium]|nr:sigma-70 family RNA polymerase sigma factor [Candidatus Vogelbacteria bacterium]
MSEREVLILSQIDFVRSLALKVCEKLPLHLRFEDFYSAGLEALIESADCFDSKKSKATFKTFCYRHVLGAMYDCLRPGLVLSMRTQRSHRKDLDKVEVQLSHKLLRRPTLNEMAEAMGLTLERVEEKIGKSHVGILSLNAHLGGKQHEEELSPLSEVVKDDQTHDPIAQILREERRDIVRRALEDLKPIHRQLLVWYYLEGLNQEQIVAMYGRSSSSAVSQQLKTARGRLKQSLQKYKKQDVL